DGGAKVKISADLVYRYGKKISDQNLVDMGIYAYNFNAQGEEKSLKREVPDSLLRQLPDIFNHEDLIDQDVKPPYLRDVWLQGIEVAAVRETGGDFKGFYLATKGGHNAESHNHNDIGQFIVYYDGNPVIVDVGVETYTAKTFSKNRYDMWTMQSQYHNLPTIKGVGQKEGKEYRAEDMKFKSTNDGAEILLDIGAAYPKEAGIKKWLRKCVLNRIDRAYINIIDEFELTNETDDIMISLIVPHSSRIDNEEGTIDLSSDNYDITITF